MYIAARGIGSVLSAGSDPVTFSTYLDGSFPPPPFLVTSSSLLLVRQLCTNINVINGTRSKLWSVCVDVCWPARLTSLDPAKWVNTLSRWYLTRSRGSYDTLLALHAETYSLVPSNLAAVPFTHPTPIVNPPHGSHHSSKRGECHLHRLVPGVWISFYFMKQANVFLVWSYGFVKVAESSLATWV